MPLTPPPRTGDAECLDGEDGVLIGDCVLLRVLPDAFECEYSDVCSSFLLFLELLPSPFIVLKKDISYSC